MVFPKKTVQLLVELDQYSHLDNAILHVQKMEYNTRLNQFLYILFDDDNFD